MGDKTSIELSDTKRRMLGMGPAADEVKVIRDLWEQTANRALAQAGRVERVDARSLKAQGIDREATTHLGPVASEMERRGRASDRGDGNRRVVANNVQRQVIRAEIINLHAERGRRERVRQADAIPADELVKMWNARKRELTRDYQIRAQQLDGRVWREIKGIATSRDEARRKHAQTCPQEPAGLFGVFRRGAYERALHVWQATTQRIQAWKQEREDDLRKRLVRVREFLAPSAWKLAAVVEARLKRERPEWAARMPAAQAEVARQQNVLKAEKQLQQKNRPTRDLGR
ncbi:Ti-type conjugative transfer relaxase TraA [compost metagenome]